MKRKLFACFLANPWEERIAADITVVGDADRLRRQCTQRNSQGCRHGHYRRGAC